MAAMEVKRPSAPGAGPGAREQFLETQATPVCARLLRDAEYLTAEDLYQLLMHMVTVPGHYTFNRSSHTIRADTGLFGQYPERTIQVVAFTLKDANPGQTKIYRRFGELNDDLTKFYDDWYARTFPRFAGAGGAGGAAVRPAMDNFIETFQQQFLNSSLWAQDINRWKLRDARMVTVRPRDPILEEDAKIAPGSPAYYDATTRYRFTFIGPEGNPITLDFHPSDVIFFCSYEPTEEIQRKRTLEAQAQHLYRTNQPTTRTPARFLHAYEDEHESAGCPTEMGADAKAEPISITDLVTEIVHQDAIARYGPRGRSSAPWRQVSSAQWQAQGIDNGKPVNYVPGFKYGVPTLSPSRADNSKLRLMGVERFLDDVYRLSFEQKEGSWYQRNPKFDVYLHDDDTVYICRRPGA